MSTSSPASPILYLASSSPYRAALLQQLNLPFEQLSPNCDESPLVDEPLPDLVRRLSETKARAVLTQLRQLPSGEEAQAVVIGSDQVADLNGELLGKPGDRETAFDQLKRVSGQRIVFRTGLCVIDSPSQRQWIDTVNTEACFRQLASTEINRYLDHESPYDCAGSFRLEGMGPSLLDSMTSSDPSALIGLPLIKLSTILRGIGLLVP